jgi:hypothetical protein
VTFLHPGAFAALASILLLILLSLWRQRPTRVVVPSVRLWERIPDRIPPVRAMRRPRANLSLILQIVAAAALVTAMAGPGVVRPRPGPRRIAVVVDLSAPMIPRMGDARRELAKLDPADDIVLIESPSLARHEGLGDPAALKPVERAGDPRPALDLAASEAKQIVFVGDRIPAWSPPSGVKLHLALVGGPLRNVGIVDANVEDGKLFLRLSAPAEVELKLDGRALRLAGSATCLVEIPEGTSRIEAALAPDEFPADDRVVLEREGGPVEVELEGRPDPAIRAAIEANPRARIVRNGNPRLRIRVGAPPGRAAPVVVDVDPAAGVEEWLEPGILAVAPHPLTREVEAEDLRFSQVGRLAGPVEAVLIHGPGGFPVAAVRKPGEIVLAVRYAATGWPVRPSFPIFWANVIEYAGSGAGAWRARGLLDEAASRPGMERWPLDPAALGERPVAPVRTDFTGESIVLAGLLLALLWGVERRSGDAE